MSLVVAAGGRYRDYILPEKSIARKISKVFKTDNDNDLVLKEEFDREQENSESKNTKQSIGVSKYVKAKGIFKVKRENIFARDIMSSPVKLIDKKTLASEAYKMMDKYQYRHFPVVEENKIIGIISDRDLVGRKTERDFNSLKISSFVTDEVIVAKLETELKMIARIMVYEEIGALPIINDEYEVVGIVTKTDILKCVMNNMRFDVLV